MIVEEWAEAGNLWRLMAAAAGGMLTEQQLVSMVLEPLVRYGSLRPVYFVGWPWSQSQGVCGRDIISLMDGHWFPCLNHNPSPKSCMGGGYFRIPLRRLHPRPCL